MSREGCIVMVLLILGTGFGLTVCTVTPGPSRAQVPETDTVAESSQRSEPIPQRWKKHAIVPVRSLTSKPFFIFDRTKQIKQYPCRNCHKESLDGKTGRGRPRKAHWDIENRHGDNQRKMTCSTCHNTNNMNTLTGPSGDTYPMSRAHRNCEQCHKKQVKNWAGGFHGLHYDSQDKIRLLYSCGNCHNPHDPSS